MGRTAKPWWWDERECYCAIVNGQRVQLGTNLKAAQTTLKHLLATRPKRRKASIGSVEELSAQFLDWIKANRSERTHQGYKDFLDSFSNSYPRLPAQAVTPKHATRWVESKAAWGPTTRRRAIEALSRALNWGRRNLGMDSNPLAGIEKPRAKTRTETISIQEMRSILRATKDKAFRRLLVFSWDTGCRPQEAKQLEPRHAQLNLSRCVLPVGEGKDKGRVRVIYLPTQRSRRMVEEGMNQSRLFLNTRGMPWTRGAIRDRFRRLEPKIGKRYRQYALRHTWITRKLVAGVDSHVVAKLSGHSSTKMLDTVYSHVADDYAFLLAEAQRERR